MATLIARADGNLTDSTTFAAAETGTGAAQIIRGATNTFAAAGNNTTSAFTVTNGKVIDAAIVWIANEFAGTPNGTLKVDLQKGGVSQASVTVNKADLPFFTNLNNIGPVLFKFTGTATGDGGSNWTLVSTTTGTTNLRIVYFSSAFTGITRALRTTTTVTPAVGDDLHILGELTGAGTRNVRVVTMDSVAAIAYGNGAVNTGSVAGGLVAVGNHGTLSYGIAASTNYIFRVKGDLIVYINGTLNIGSPGAEIPRSSTAVLEFQQATADGDFGLRSHDAVVNIAGLSRTAGKNVVKCKLTANVASVNLLGAGNSSGWTSNSIGSLDPSGTTIAIGNPIENTSAGLHYGFYTAPSVTNVTQTAGGWFSRGTGANNRYFRFMVGNTNNPSTVVNGFYTDVDLQAGTASGPTAIGNGVATGVSIVPAGRGYWIELTGKVSTAAASPSWILANCNAPGVTSYTGSGQSTIVYYTATLLTTVSIPDTTFNVDTDTGWLANDVVCIASTSTAPGDCWVYQLNADAGASSFASTIYPSHGNLLVTHSGVAPTQAEIGLLTRNVKIRSATTNWVTYVYLSALSTANISWAEFSYYGIDVFPKHGIEIESGAITNMRSFAYCSFHDTRYAAISAADSGSTSLKLSVTNCVAWWSNYGGSFSCSTFQIRNAITNSGEWTFDNNLVIRQLGPGSTGCFTLNDVGGTFTNNTAVGANNDGMLIPGADTVGTWSGNTVHSNGSTSILWNGASSNIVINNLTCWRNGHGFLCSGTSPYTFNNLTVFGCGFTTPGDVRVIGAVGTLTINGGLLAGDNVTASQRGISIENASPLVLNMLDVDMSGTGSIYTPHTVNDFYFHSVPIWIRGNIVNCKFGNTTSIFGPKAGVWDARSYMGFMKYNQVAGDHRMETPTGRYRTDVVAYNNVLPSMRLTARSANKMESAAKEKGIQVAVNNAESVTASVWVMKDAGYGGAQPRLIVRANPAIGIMTDTVLAACVDTRSTTASSVWDEPNNVTISGGGLVATNTNPGTTILESGARVGPSAGRNSGKYYFECTMTNFAGGNNVGFGVGPPANSYANMSNGAQQGGVTVDQTGLLRQNGSGTGVTINGFGNGHVIGFAIDMDAKKLWCRNNSSSGAWNAMSGTTNNPATGVGGVTFTLLPGVFLVPFCFFGNNSTGAAGNVFTANFSGTMGGAVPAGYTAGWNIPVGTPGTAVWQQLIGTSPIATDDGVMEFIIDCDTGGFINIDDWVFS